MAEGKEATTSLEELKAIVTAAVNAALKNSNASNELIANALLESRKPYTDPKQKANEESSRIAMREQARKQKETLEAGQKLCPHKKGSHAQSFRNDPFDSALARHRLDTGEVIGICTVCTKVFSSLNPEDIPWLNEKSSNQMSSAEVRNFDDPRKAQRARLGIDQKEIFADENGAIVQR